MPILLRSATYVAHPHSHNLSTRSNESKKKERRFCVPYFLRLQTSRANGCGGRIWTNDLRVMSPMSYQTALPRDIKYAHRSHSANIWYAFAKYLSSFLVAYWIFFVDFVQKRTKVYPRSGVCTSTATIFTNDGAAKGHFSCDGKMATRGKRKTDGWSVGSSFLWSLIRYEIN